MSNFIFLKTDWPELYETAREAEQNVASTPLSHRLYARRSLERAVRLKRDVPRILCSPTKSFTTVSKSDTKFL